MPRRPAQRCFEADCRKHLPTLKRLASGSEAEAKQILEMAPKNSAGLQQFLGKVAGNLACGHFPLTPECRHDFRKRRDEIYKVAQMDPSEQSHYFQGSLRGASLAKKLSGLTISALNCPYMKHVDYKPTKRDRLVTNT